MLDLIARSLGITWGVLKKLKRWFDNYALGRATSQRERMVKDRLRNLFTEAQQRLDQGLLTFVFIRDHAPGVKDQTLRRWLDEIGARPARRRRDKAELWGLPPIGPLEP